MFYSKALLSKKGALGTVWVAAFCREAALSRDQVARTDIIAAVGKGFDVNSCNARAIPPFVYRIFRVVLMGIRVGQEAPLSNNPVIRDVGLEQRERQGDEKVFVGF